MLTQHRKVMRKLLIGAAAATMFIAVAPAFANPAQEAEEDYEGWRAAQRAGVSQQTKMQNAPVKYRSHREGR
jgi:hypothetical protein